MLSAERSSAQVPVNLRDEATTGELERGAAIQASGQIAHEMGSECPTWRETHDAGIANQCARDFDQQVTRLANKPKVKNPSTVAQMGNMDKAKVGATGHR